MKSLLRHSLPAGQWEPLQPPPGLIAWRHPERNLQVLESTGIQDDGREWYHVSCARRLSQTTFELPSWDDLKFVWATFIGEDHVAYQVFPRKRDWINIHEYVLHLWHCPEDEDVLPNFGSKGTI